MKSILACCAFLLLCLGLGACGSTNTGSLPPDWNNLNNGNNGNNNGGNQSGNEIAISVSNLGPNPTFTWSGGGGQSLAVVRTSNPGVPVWVIATPGRDGVTSPVVHGTVPAGAFEGVGTERNLTPGVEYRVTVARIGTNNAGWVEFTP